MSCIGLENRPRLERRHSWQDALYKPITDYRLLITSPLALHPSTGVEHWLKNKQKAQSSAACTQLLGIALLLLSLFGGTSNLLSEILHLGNPLRHLISTEACI